ncbi:MFS transporter [Methylicorpusculum sp.]|uniref:MFS transporter n=1 Tax=Methylicorpusculum sp. TaxID=2713644 RepID=UPI002ABA9496|nr:MFS transporter [Methylicorpusculum sp.]MDZ4151795.1 MFS transporter [Methylicorpusculum sp.]
MATLVFLKNKIFFYGDNVMRFLSLDRVRAGISRNIFFMGVVSFFNDISSEMIYPIWPFFLTDILGAPITAVGLIEGTAEAASSIFNVISGRLSDHVGRRKPFVVFGYSLATVSKFLLGFAGSWRAALVGRTGDRFGKGIRTAARDALIAENSSFETRGVAFGLHRGMDAFGAVLGPLITLAILPAVSLRSIFFLAAIPGVLCVVIFVVCVREVYVASQEVRTLVPWLSLGAPFFTFVGINMLFAFGNSSDVFIILRTHVLGFSLAHVILLRVLLNMTYSFFSLPAGRLSDRIGPRRVMIIGFVLFSLVYFSFGFISRPAWFWLLLPLYGIFLALTEGVGRAYISHLVPCSALGSAYGVYQVTTGLATFLASFVAGLLWSHVSSSAPFFLGGSMALGAALLLLVVERRHLRIPVP